MNYESTKMIQSAKCPGVRLTIRRMTLGRRLEMIRHVKERAKRLEFHQAGDSLEDVLSSSLLACEIERIYLEWGLIGVEGLEIDGAPATKESLYESGPEHLCKEVIEAVKSEIFLTESERKN